MVKSILRKVREILWSRLNQTRQLKSGIKIRIAGFSDWVLYNDIFVEGEYDPPIRHVIDNRLDNRILHIVDLGANVGFFTLRFLDLLRRTTRNADCEMVLIEGSPSVFSVLTNRISIQIDSVRKNITLLQGLAGERSGDGMISEGVFAASNFVAETYQRGYRQIPFLDLDQVFCSWTYVDLLKCDIEGCEQSFLENYPALLKKTRSVVVEIHTDKCDLQRCLSLLKQSGLERQKELQSEGGNVLYFCSSNTNP